MIFGLIFFIPMMFIIAVLFIAVGIYYVKQKHIYEKSEYRKQKGVSYNVFRKNVKPGQVGEYRLYKKIRGFEKNGARFLFNCYVPREDGTDSEIDVIMISQKGIFVFESKDYKGWIFGSEDDTYWTQTLMYGNKVGKNRFYNPIRQNRGHVEALRKNLKQIIPIFSVVVFGSKCKLKKIRFNRNNVIIAKTDNLLLLMKSLYSGKENVISLEDVNMIYFKLYPLTQVSEKVKEKHISNISGNQIFDKA